MASNIDETELARLEALAAQYANSVPNNIYDDCRDTLSRTVPALVAEIRGLRATNNMRNEACEKAIKLNERLFAENAALREKVEAWEWLFEVIEYDVYEDHPLAGRWGYDMSDNEREAYTNARVSHANMEKAAREAVHADRE